MSVDDSVLATIAEAAARVKLEFVLVGNAAAALQDAPVMTQDFDLFVRYTPRNLEKIRAFAQTLNADILQPYDPVSRMMRLLARKTEIPVDFVFDLSSRAKFESVRSRSTKIAIGKHAVRVASLEDIIAAKEAANRPKDRATLPILKATLRTRKAMEREGK